MWCLRTWFSGEIGGVRLTAGLDEVKGLFQPQKSYDFPSDKAFQYIFITTQSKTFKTLDTRWLSLLKEMEYKLVVCRGPRSHEFTKIDSLAFLTIKWLYKGLLILTNFCKELSNPYAEKRQEIIGIRDTTMQLSITTLHFCPLHSLAKWANPKLRREGGV